MDGITATAEVWGSPLKTVAFWVFLLILALLGIAFVHDEHRLY